MTDIQKQLAEALQIARDHIDMKALEISHCKDAAIIRAALAAHRQQEARGPLTEIEIADAATGIKPYPLELVQVPAEQVVALVRATEAAHGIKGE